MIKTIRNIVTAFERFESGNAIGCAGVRTEKPREIDIFSAERVNDEHVCGFTAGFMHHPPLVVVFKFRQRTL